MIYKSLENSDSGNSVSVNFLIIFVILILL
jgi:hypothetical protein